MSQQEPHQKRQEACNEFVMNAIVFGPIRPAPDLVRETQRVVKAHSSGRDHFTKITIHQIQNHQLGAFRIEYTVTANSPKSAERVGAVYLSQLCDLLSVATQSPVWFYMPEDDSREERARQHRQSTTLNRTLTKDEWLWITGDLVFLQREHPRFLAAASWYRKGLIGNDSLDDFCCFWRVIERIAYSYADKSDWLEEDRSKCPVKKCVLQLVSDIFNDGSIPDLLADPSQIATVLKLRNDLSHGNEPITPKVIETASGYLNSLEAAAFSVLQRIKHLKFKSKIQS